MHWLDITLIVILALFTLIGLSKGFFSQLLSLINTLVSLVVALFLAKPFAKFLTSATKLDNKLTDVFADKLAKVGTLGEPLTQSESVKNVLGTTNLTNFFKNLISKITGNATLEAGTVPSTYFGDLISTIIVYIIALVLIFIAIRIIVGLLSKLFAKLKTSSIINSLDKLLGTVFGLIKGVIFIGLIFAVIQFVPFVNSKSVEIINETKYCKEVAGYVEDAVDFMTDKIDFEKIIKQIK